jgi:hypothetical protein
MASRLELRLKWLVNKGRMFKSIAKHVPVSCSRVGHLSVIVECLNSNRKLISQNIISSIVESSIPTSAGG